MLEMIAHKEPVAMYADRLITTLIELIGIPSTSGHEEKIRAYLAQYLASLGLSSTVDASGNLISTVSGEGAPLLLNAHMDRVPPGLGHQPILRKGVLYSDGTTNLGADDAAGIAIILEVSGVPLCSAYHTLRWSLCSPFKKNL